MSTTDWPTSIVPAAVQWQLQKAGTQFTSPFNGTTQAVDYVAERWQVSLSLPAVRSAGAVAALLNNMAGGVNRVNLWHHGTGGQPAGTLRGSPTLGAGAARGDSTLTLAGATGANWVMGGSFELDSNSDGLADGWTRYSNGTVGALSAVRSTGVFSAGSYSQSLSAASMGSASTDRQGIVRNGLGIVGLAGQRVTLQAVVLGTLNSTAHIEVDWKDAGGGVISGLETTAACTTGYQTLSVTGVCPSNAASAVVYVVQEANTGGGAPSLYVDAVQLVLGTPGASFPAPATLLAGDMIGCSGHLFQVAADCAANDAGAMTVPLVNRVRATIASGTAVTWYRPTAQFIMPAMTGGTMQVPGFTQGAALDLVEVY